MNNAQVIRDLLRQNANQKCYVSGKVFFDGKEQTVLVEVKSIRESQFDDFNEGEKFTRIIF